MWAHSESFPLAAWRSRGWAAESIFHLTLHTAGLRLAPVLICKKGSICIHQDSAWEARRGWACFRASKQREVGRGEGMPGGVRLAGKSQAGQRPLEWQERHSLHQTIDCRGGGNILHQTRDLEPKGAWSRKYLQELLSTGLILLMEKLRPREKIEFSERHTSGVGLFWVLCLF